MRAAAVLSILLAACASRPAPPDQDAEWRRVAEEAFKRYSLNDQSHPPREGDPLADALRCELEGDLEGARRNAEFAVQFWPGDGAARVFLRELNAGVPHGHSINDGRISRCVFWSPRIWGDLQAHVFNGHRYFGLRLYEAAIAEFEEADFRIKHAPCDIPEARALAPQVDEGLREARAAAKR